MAMFPVRTPEGKKNAVNFLLPHIHRVSNRIVREGLATDLAQKLGIDSNVLRQEFKSAATSRAAGGPLKSIADDSSLTDGEKHLVRLLFRTKDEVSELGYDPQELILKSLAESAFHIGLGTESLLAAIVDQKHRIDDVLALNLAESDRSRLMRLIANALPRYTEVELQELLLVLKHRRYKQEIEVELPKRIQEALSRGDMSRFKELTERKMRLAQEMRPLADVSRS